MMGKITAKSQKKQKCRRNLFVISSTNSLLFLISFLPAMLFTFLLMVLVDKNKCLSRKICKIDLK